MIRLATPDDVPELVALGGEYLRELGVEKPRDRALQVVELVMAADGGTGLVIEQSEVVDPAFGPIGLAPRRELVGLLAWTLDVHQWTGRLSAFEVAWFQSVHHEAFGTMREVLELPRVAEQKARDQGALDFYLTVRQDRLGAILENMGYTAVNRTYLRALDGDAAAEQRVRDLKVGR